MGFYEKHLLPRLIDFVCNVKPARLQREKVVPLACGQVLEIGIGTGHNLPYYDRGKVQKIWGLDPAPEMTRRAIARIRNAGLDVTLLEGSGEEIPLQDASVDTVLMTYTLCSIPDPTRALREMRRVLKPGGELIYCEHGLAPDERVRRWQDRLTPTWRKLAGGCHLNRPIADLIAQAGFALHEPATAYLPGPKPLTFNYWGTARPV
jgi:ubiquinone/menaquinone biosynthesis C-methylase UbiE